jgi:hypothetical protein
MLKKVCSIFGRRRSQYENPLISSLKLSSVGWPSVNRCTMSGRGRPPPMHRSAQICCITRTVFVPPDGGRENASRSWSYDVIPRNTPRLMKYTSMGRPKTAVARSRIAMFCFSSAQRERLGSSGSAGPLIDPESSQMTTTS